jgi:LacI family transcriptional regulator
LNTAALKSPATSAEVARQAGVSRTTVSFVLNDVRDRGISEATREKVLAVARELGYEPNAAARMLVSGSSGSVGLVIPKAAHLYSDVFLSQLVASVNEACHRSGLKLLIETTEDEGNEPGGFVNLVRARRIDGLIVVNLRASEHQHLHRIADAGIPLVVFGCGIAGLERFHTMGRDNLAATQAAVAHLQGLGHRRIGHVSFAPPDYLSVNERERGWREALAAQGVAPDPAWLEHGDISAESGYQATRRLLARQQQLPAERRISALFAGNDTIAFGAMHAIHAAGLRVPDDIAVVGYDDIPLAAFANPPLTTIRTDPVAHGREAMQRLVAQLRGQTQVASPASVVPELVVRRSCGTPID